MSVVPMLAPTAGGLIVQGAGWRTIFWVAAAYGVICMLLTWRFLGETRPAGAGARESVLSIGLHYVAVLKDRVFATHALTAGFATFSLFAFLGGAPSVFLVHFGMRPVWFGALFIANGAGFAAGTWLNTLAIQRIGHPRVLTVAAGGLLAGSICMVLCALHDTFGLWGIEGPMIAIMIALGCLLPDAAIGAIGLHGRDAGIASALYGTGVFAVGALGTIGAGLIGHDSAVPLAMLLLLGAMLAVAASVLRPVSAEW